MIDSATSLPDDNSSPVSYRHLQMKLVADMEDKWDRMNDIVQKAAQKVR